MIVTHNIHDTNNDNKPENICIYIYIYIYIHKVYMYAYAYTYIYIYIYVYIFLSAAEVSAAEWAAALFCEPTAPLLTQFI